MKTKDPHVVPTTIQLKVLFSVVVRKSVIDVELIFKQMEIKY